MQQRGPPTCDAADEELIVCEDTTCGHTTIGEREDPEPLVGKKPSKEDALNVETAQLAIKHILRQAGRRFFRAS